MGGGGGELESLLSRENHFLLLLSITFLYFMFSLQVEVSDKFYPIFELSVNLAYLFSVKHCPTFDNLVAK